MSHNPPAIKNSHSRELFVFFVYDLIWSTAKQSNHDNPTWVYSGKNWWCEDARYQGCKLLTKASLVIILVLHGRVKWAQSPRNNLRHGQLNLGPSISHRILHVHDQVIWGIRHSWAVLNVILILGPYPFSKLELYSCEIIWIKGSICQHNPCYFIILFFPREVSEKYQIGNQGGIGNTTR